MIKYGIDNIGMYLDLFKGKRVGLLTSISGRNSLNKSTISIINDKCNLVALFAPEHGVRGDKDAGEHVQSYIDDETGLTVYSLYRGKEKGFTKEMLECFDVLIYDIQDIGVRFYTFLSTLHDCIKQCSNSSKEFVVLDRPNPLGGEIIEGGLLDMKFSSFIGIYELPIRYALTSGEVAKMINDEMKYDCKLHVIQCTGWDRRTLFSDWGKVWNMPSLGLPTFETTLLYPGTCLIEGTNVSEGRGTSAPFRIIGAPFIDSELFSLEFNQLNFAGVVSTPIWFKPTTSKYKDELCGGILLHVVDSNKVASVTIGINIIYLLKELYPNNFKFLPPYVDGGRQFISLLTGNDDLVLNIDKNIILDKYTNQSGEFKKRKQKYHLY